MFDDDLPRKKIGPLDDVIKEDLDPLSIDQLQDRIVLLKGEIARVEADIARKSAHRSAADALFKKP